MNLTKEDITWLKYPVTTVVTQFGRDRQSQYKSKFINKKINYSRYDKDYKKLVHKKHFQISSILHFSNFTRMGMLSGSIEKDIYISTA
jgi:hypothetical protein